MKEEHVDELLFQALETEQGGVQVYKKALECAVNDELKKEWQEYLEQTQRHEQILLGVFDRMGLDSTEETPGRQVVRHKGDRWSRRWRWPGAPATHRPRS